VSADQEIGIVVAVAGISKLLIVMKDLPQPKKKARVAPKVR
jgi:hypothetical protein